jgi:hypothetical protein
MPNAHFVLPAPDYPTKIANLDEIKQIIEIIVLGHAHHFRMRARL